MSIIIINNSPESNLLVFSVSQPNHQALFHVTSPGCNNNQKATLLSSPISQVPRLFYTLCLQYNASPERNRVGFSVFPKYPGLIIRHCSTSLVCGVIIPRKQPWCLLRFAKSQAVSELVPAVKQLTTMQPRWLLPRPQVPRMITRDRSAAYACDGAGLVGFSLCSQMPD